MQRARVASFAIAALVGGSIGWWYFHRPASTNANANAPSATRALDAARPLPSQRRDDEGYDDDDDDESADDHGESSPARAKAPPRTPATDPNLTSAEPLVADLSPLPRGRDTNAHAWSGATLLASLVKNDRSTVLSWADLAAPPIELVTVDGTIEAIVPSPDGRLAIVTVQPKHKEILSSVDPRKVLVVGADRKASVLYDAGERFELGLLAHVAWTPDGKRLAIDGTVHEGTPPFRMVTRVVDVATRAVVAETPVAGADADAHDAVSPDGRFRIAWTTAGLRVTSARGGASRVFTPKMERDRRALQASGDGEARWLGPHRLVLESDDVVVLDLESLGLRLVTTHPDVVFVAASADGSRVLMATDEGRTMLAAQIRR